MSGHGVEAWCRPHGAPSCLARRACGIVAVPGSDGTVRDHVPQDRHRAHERAPDGTWTWRAAGAKEPRGVLDGALLPTGAATGAVYKADAEINLDGTTILSVATVKEKSSKGNLLEILPSERPFEGVTSQLTGRDSREGRDRRERRDRPPRRSDDGGGPSRGPRRDGAPARPSRRRPARG